VKVDIPENVANGLAWIPFSDRKNQFNGIWCGYNGDVVGILPRICGYHMTDNWGWMAQKIHAQSKAQCFFYWISLFWGLTLNRATYFMYFSVCYWLVVWNMFYFSIQLGMSSSQLTNSIIFQRGRSGANMIGGWVYWNYPKRWTFGVNNHAGSVSSPENPSEIQLLMEDCIIPRYLLAICLQKIILRFSPKASA
jgi:hypothetical protein